MAADREEKAPKVWPPEMIGDRPDEPLLAIDELLCELLSAAFGDRIVRVDHTVERREYETALLHVYRGEAAGGEIDVRRELVPTIASEISQSLKGLIPDWKRMAASPIVWSSRENDDHEPVVKFYTRYRIL